MSGRIINIVSILIVSALMLGVPAGALAAETTNTATEATTTAGSTDSSAPVVTQTNVTETGTPLENLNVSYWPEYDDPSVLVMYRGRVDASIQTPAKLKIAIPKGDDVRLVATSAIDPNGQFQYDAAWNSKELVDAGEMTILTYEIIHPEFQFEIYLQPVDGRGKRDFNFALPSISEIKTLSVDIKKPVRAEEFKATPVAARTTQDGEFENHLYSFSNVSPGQKYAFNVTYNRADSNPSVDKQTGFVDTSGGSSQTALIVILVVTVIGVAIGVGMWRMRAAPVTPARARPVKGKTGTKSGGKGKSKNKSQSGSKGGAKGKDAQPQKKKFCASCGEKIPPESKFCPECGKEA